MRKSLLILGLCAAFVGTAVAPTEAQSRGGETGLVGIDLFDTGFDLLRVYGNPDMMLPLNVAIGSAPGTGRGLPSAQQRPPGGSGNQNPPGGGGDTRTPEIDARNLPPGLFGFGDEIIRQGGPRRGAGPQGSGGGAGGFGAGNPSGDPRGGGQPGGAPPRSGGSSTTSVPRGDSGLPWIRWVYKRNGCYYGFILDKNNRVVQIEAIGLQNNKVRTRRGVRFGDTFKDVMMKYSTPEGYQVNGDTIVMRYLTEDKIAFRLNRLGEDKPHVVTAIVVSAGKV